MHSQRLIRGSLVLALAAVTGLSGCTGVKPDSLRRPSSVTCIELPHTMHFSEERGLFDIKFTTWLASGPYWAERSDVNGTYYRAPPGGIVVTVKKSKPGDKGTLAHDGGIYVPRYPNLPFRLYAYNDSTQPSSRVKPTHATCATLRYTQDPASGKISVRQMAIASAVGGAMGGIAGRAMTRNSGMSYGQSAGVGLAGGLLGGLIIAAINNANAGRLVLGKPIQDPTFTTRLRALSAKRVVLQKAPAKAPPKATNGAPASPTPAASPSPSATAAPSPSTAPVAPAAANTARDGA